ESHPRLLAGFPPELSAAAAEALCRLGVELRLGAKVSRCDDCAAVLDDERIESRTLIWAAGGAASPAAKWLGGETGRAGRVGGPPDLTVPGHSEIFVIGDTAELQGPQGPLPGLAPVAKQQGAYGRPGHRRAAEEKGGAAAVPLPQLR